MSVFLTAKVATRNGYGQRVGGKGERCNCVNLPSPSIASVPFQCDGEYKAKLLNCRSGRRSQARASDRNEATKGFSFIRQYAESRPSTPVPLVSQILDDLPAMQTEYLLGDEPQWADLLNGKAIERAHDEALLETATQILDGKLPATALALTGTAGTGKSTALMSLALKLSGSGVPVIWVDKESEASPMRMRQRVREFKDKVVLAIDDADMYGRELLTLLHDLVPHHSRRTIASFTYSALASFRIGMSGRYVRRDTKH
jgi:Protein of unknown function (DUF815)